MGLGVAFLRVCAGVVGVSIMSAPTYADPERFEARALAAASDVDMAGTAYADGGLKPLSGQQDALTLVTQLDAAPPDTRAVSASNSVMGWPGTLEASPDGRLVYVVETRGPAPEGATQIDVYSEMPGGTLLTTVDVSDPGAPRVVDARPVGENPMSVHVSPDGRWLIIGTRTVGGELSIVPLDARGVPTGVRTLDVGLPGLTQRPIDDGALFARLSPAGDVAAVNLANTHVAFVGLETGADGVPVAGRMIGEPVAAGDWLAMGRWTKDGRHFLVADTGWGPRPTDAAFNQAGAIVSVRYDAGGAHQVVSRAVTSQSPEGFDLSNDGTKLAVVNMERTYLPRSFPLVMFPRRGFSSLSLVTVDEATGALTTVGRPVRFRGVLPEDAVFDCNDDTIAVAVFHDHVRQPTEGWVALFALTGDDRRPFRELDTRIMTARGAHDLVVLD